MRQLGGVLGLLCAVCLASSASAQSKGWTVCGGNTFATCASVTVFISGAHLVTTSAQTLSGTNGVRATTGFTRIGLANVTPSVCLVPSGATCATSRVHASGPTETGDNGPPTQKSEHTGSGTPFSIETAANTSTGNEQKHTSIGDGTHSDKPTGPPSGSGDEQKNGSIGDGTPSDKPTGPPSGGGDEQKSRSNGDGTHSDKPTGPPSGSGDEQKNGSIGDGSQSDKPTGPPSGSGDEQKNGSIGDGTQSDEPTGTSSGTGGEGAAANSKSWTVCGGNTFATCASVTASVSGNNVTLTVMNLSGRHGTYGGTIFTGIGLYNVPSSVCLVSGSICATRPVQSAMSGPTRMSNQGTASAWYVQNHKQIGGGVNLGLVGQTGNNRGRINNGIGGNCRLSAVPGGKNNFWMDPTCGTTGVKNSGTNGGFVVFSFHVNHGWALSTTQLLVKGQNGPNGQSTECFTGTTPSGQAANCFATVAPEPTTMALFASGLVGLSGAGLLRRRRGRDVGNS